jgi:hypothetical protein
MRVAVESPLVSVFSQIPNATSRYEVDEMVRITVSSQKVGGLKGSEMAYELETTSRVPGSHQQNVQISGSGFPLVPSPVFWVPDTRQSKRWLGIT